MDNLVMLARPEEALAERIRREKARRHLVEFSEYVDRKYIAARHHKLVGALLEKVELYIRTKGAEGIGRLMLFEPPRHGKSEQVSRKFPAWLLGRDPDFRVILASYNADLATDHNRAVRDIVLSDRFGALFGSLASRSDPVELSEDSRSVKSWDLASPHRGGIVAAGVGGGVTGKGADLLIIDDPFKNREEAESESHREKVYDWYRSSAYTRLEDGAAVVLMHTRWNPEDLAGKLLKQMALDERADRWTVVNLPALAEVNDLRSEIGGQAALLEGLAPDAPDPLGRTAGEALWPEKYSAEDLERIRANVGDYDFESLYQQRPYRRSGSIFKREWFAIVDTLPSREEVVGRIRAWDKAGTASGEGGDWAVGVRMSITRDDVIYVEHVSRGRYTPLGREEEILRCAKADREQFGEVTIWHQQDPASAGLDSAQATSLALAKRGFTARFEPVTGDKEVRAGPWSTACQAGRVRLVRGSWNAAFIEEHVAFPKGKFDDQVDASSWGYVRLNSISPSGGIFV